MKLGALSVKNYRALREVSVTLSNFSCLIGENNAGKSSVLQSLILLQSGTALPSHNYFDPGQDISIDLTLEEIDQRDLDRLHPEHRVRISQIVKNGRLRLVRRYNLQEKSRLRYIARVPGEVRFTETAIDSLMSGGKPGAAFATRIVAAFPEISERVTNQTNQTQARQLITAYESTLPDDAMVDSERDLPTGFDKSVSALLPEPIYVPAVKDFSDDIKTKEGTPLGKILAILLEQIEEQLTDAATWFSSLNSRLNRTVNEAGQIIDGRMSEVREVESLVESYVAETFTAVKLRLEIPPPEIKTILAGTRIFANDGVEGPLETKGDGLRRAVIFAILRSYVEIRRRLLARQVEAGGDAQAAPPDQQTIGRYLLLFEEPELYLHPTAQKILFDALAAFSRSNIVVVTTHSPVFFGPEATTTFVKLRKTAVGASKPYTQIYPISLQGVSEKDQFQIICYENNNAAFFGDTVVLVEGPSDFLALPHIAKTINPQWSIARNPVRFARIGGKSSIRKYRDFFGRFGIRVLVIADLDILINDFDQTDPSPEVSALRNELLNDADALITALGINTEINEERAKQAQQRGGLKVLWQRAREEYASAQANRTSLEVPLATLNEFFSFQKKDVRLEILATEMSEPFLRKKREVLRHLREKGVFILERGAIEAYYPPEIAAGDKPTRAQRFCNNVVTREAILACCSALPQPQGGTASEFEVIFGAIFRD